MQECFRRSTRPIQAARGQQRGTKFICQGTQSSSLLPTTKTRAHQKAFKVVCERAGKGADSAPTSSSWLLRDLTVAKLLQPKGKVWICMSAQYFSFPFPLLSMRPSIPVVLLLPVSILLIFKREKRKIIGSELRSARERKNKL